MAILEKIYDVELKIKEQGGGITVGSFHSGTNLNETINSLLLSTYDMLDDMYGKENNPMRGNVPLPKIDPLTALELDVLLIRSDLEEELLGEVVYVDGEVSNG